MEASARHTDRTLTVRLAGDWSLEGTIPRFADLALGSAAPNCERVTFDTAGLGRWDTSLLVFVDETVRACEERGLAVDAASLPADLQRLLELSRAVPEASVDDHDPPPGFVERLGTRTLDLADGAVEFTAFTGRVALGAGRLLRGRGRMRARDFWLIAQRSSAGALPIVTLISFLVGLILAFLGAVVLQRFGADYYVSYLVSYGVLRELGALMTAIIMAGRTGAAFAAELGSMKISEEIDALKTLGIRPVDFLVMPRLVAIAAALPLLTLYANAVAIAGGWVVAVAMLDVTTPQFFTGLLTPVTLADAVLGIVKAAVYGAIIGLSGCLRGLQTGSGASAVGDAATSAVVTGITLIVAANALLDWLAVLLDI